MTKRDTQLSRISAALKSLAEVRVKADTPLNDGRMASLELLDNATAKLQPFSSLVASAGPELDQQLTVNSNGALAYAKASIDTVLQWGIFKVDNSITSAIGQSIKGWIFDPEQNLSEFRPLGLFIGEGAKAVRDNVLQPVWDFLKKPVYALVTLAAILGAFYLYFTYFRKKAA